MCRTKVKLDLIDLEILIWDDGFEAFKLLDNRDGWREDHQENADLENGSLEAF
jgi:hypothetical protein